MQARRSRATRGDTCGKGVRCEKNHRCCDGSHLGARSQQRQLWPTATADHHPAACSASRAAILDMPHQFAKLATCAGACGWRKGGAQTSMLPRRGWCDAFKVCQGENHAARPSCRRTLTAVSAHCIGAKYHQPGRPTHFQESEGLTDRPTGRKQLGAGREDKAQSARGNSGGGGVDCARSIPGPRGDCHGRTSDAVSAGVNEPSDGLELQNATRAWLAGGDSKVGNPAWPVNSPATCLPAYLCTCALGQACDGGCCV